MEFLLYLIGTIILGVIGSILGNLLTPYTKNIFKWPRPINAEVEPLKDHLVAPEEEIPDNKEFQREKNRAKLVAISQLFFLYGYTFFVLYISIYSPIGFGVLGDNILPFSETRLYWLCETCLFTTENQTHIAAIAAISLYYPIWILAQKLVTYIEKGLDHITKITSTKYTALLVGVFFVISLFIAGHWIFLLFPKFSYLEAIGLPFIVVIIGVLIIISNNDRR